MLSTRLSSRLKLSDLIYFSFVLILKKQNSFRPPPPKKIKNTEKNCNEYSMLPWLQNSLEYHLGSFVVDYKDLKTSEHY